MNDSTDGMLARFPRHADEGRHPRLWYGMQERRGWRAFARHDGMGVVRATLEAVVVGRRLTSPT